MFMFLEDKLPSPPPIHTRVPVEEQNPHYFDSIRNDADKIVQKERIQEEYKKVGVIICSIYLSIYITVIV